MKRWPVFAILIGLAICSEGHAAQTGGSAPGGTNFGCDGTTCICNGTYSDCKDMEEKCSGKIKCPQGASYCSCTKKAAARKKPALPMINVNPQGARPAVKP